MSDEVGMPIRAGNSQMEIAPPLANNRRLVRATKNPLDRCTIISIFPKEIDEVKHTIEPGRFHIKAGSFDKPSILVVGSSSWWKLTDSSQDILLEIPVSSIQVAESIIKDNCNSMLGVQPGSAAPGVFFVLGEHSVLDIQMKYKNKLEEVKTLQDNWYKILVRLADSLWARANGNPLVIAEEMRLAAKSLNFNDKPWLKDFTTVELVKCNGCGSLKHPQYPVCPVCKTIDTEHPESKSLKFAV